MYALVGLGATLSGIALTFKKVKSVFGTATTTLQNTNEFSTKINKDINDLSNKLTVLEGKYNNALKTIEDLQIKTVALFNEKMNQVNKLVAELEPLKNLPIAFSEYISQNAALVKNGTAKKVNKTLGIGMDNVQKTIQSTTKDKVGE